MKGFSEAVCLIQKLKTGIREAPPVFLFHALYELRSGFTTAASTVCTRMCQNQEPTCAAKGFSDGRAETSYDG